MQQCQFGLQATLETLANRAVSIGLVKPKETAYKSILAAGMVAGGPDVWDNVQGNDMLAQLKELKRLIKNKAVGQDCCACPCNICVIKVSSSYRVPSIMSIAKIDLYSSITLLVGKVNPCDWLETSCSRDIFSSRCMQRRSCSR